MAEEEALLKEYLETTSFDENPDWEDEPLTDEDPDDEEEEPVE